MSYVVTRNWKLRWVSAVTLVSLMGEAAAAAGVRLLGDELPELGVTVWRSWMLVGMMRSQEAIARRAWPLVGRPKVKIAQTTSTPAMAGSARLRSTSAAGASPR